MRMFFTSLPPTPTSPWQKLLALLVFVALLALIFTLSMVLLPLLLLLAAWFWWKTRAARQQWRAMQAQMQQMHEEVARARSTERGGEIIEGEVVSVKLSTLREER
ncbi:MAG: hypothetical protein AB1722_11660 [Pseudomonadota bacterium]